MERVMVTDWELVSKDDFYLTNKDWAEKFDPETLQQAKELQAADGLYVAYIVSASNYCVYKQMDASQIFIDGSETEIMFCESEVIGNNHDHVVEYAG